MLDNIATFQRGDMSCCGEKRSLLSLVGCAYIVGQWERPGFCSACTESLTALLALSSGPAGTSDEKDFPIDTCLSQNRLEYQLSILRYGRSKSEKDFCCGTTPTEEETCSSPLQANYRLASYVLLTRHFLLHRRPQSAVCRGSSP